jgi:shikimate dehydrogenase
LTTLKQTSAIDDHTRLVGWTGRPGGPWSVLNIYNAAFDALGLNWRCVPLSVQAGQLREALLGLRALGFVGAEVAQTYQRDVLSHVENLSTAAETTGVVDLVWVDQSGQLIGDNVHWLGFLTALRAVVPSLNGLRPLIIGAGDAAGSIVYALTRQGLPLTIIDGQMHRAVDLVHRLRHVLNEHSFSVYRWPQDLKRVASNVNLIINATGIGAWPDAVRSPWPDDLSFPPSALAVDLVSWPSDTRFLRQARDSGARTVNGLSLTVCTAAMAFEKWTGHPPPIEAMRLVAGKAMVSQTPQGLLRPEDESLSPVYKSLPELT